MQLETVGAVLFFVWADNGGAAVQSRRHNSKGTLLALEHLQTSRAYPPTLRLPSARPLRLHADADTPMQTADPYIVRDVVMTME